MSWMLALTLLAASPPPPACGTMTKAEAQAFLGQPVERVIPEAPEPDEETGSVHTTCTFMGKTRALIISIDEFPSAAAATKKMNAEYLASRDMGDDDGPPPKVEPEQGLGDAGYYAQSQHGAMILMLKGARAYGAVLGGAVTPGPGDRAMLRNVVAGVAAKS